MASVKKLRKDLDALLNYLRENYIELNIYELSHGARQEYIEFVSTMEEELKSIKRKNGADKANPADAD